MAYLETRTLPTGEERFDVRSRVGEKQQKRSFKHESLARSFKRKVEADELRGLVIDRRGGDERFGAYAEAWLRSRLVKGQPLSPMTLQGYQGLVRRHILPTFEHERLRAIEPADVREWYARISTDASPDTAAKSYRLLRAILNTAMDDDLIARNPCRIRGGGQERASERPMPTTEEVLAAANAIDPRYKALVLLAGFGGLRAGELFGLRRMDVDALHRVVHVRVQATEVGGFRVVSRPKTDAGIRSIVLPTRIIESLEEHLATYAQPGADGVVFTAPMGGPARRASLHAAWTAARASLGIDGVHLHDLRHHAATLAARSPGITTKELMARLGHASPRAALIYQHATAERDCAVADFLDAQIAAVEPESMAPVVPITERT
jgi:integrase